MKSVEQYFDDECCCLVDPDKQKKLQDWVKVIRNKGYLSADFIMMFCVFWRELIIAGLDSETLLDLARNWHQRDIKRTKPDLDFLQKIVAGKQPHCSVYFIADEHGRVKIGNATNPEDRLRALQTGNPDQLQLLRVIAGDEATETWLHKHFDALHIKGEWFHYHDEMLTIVVPSNIAKAA